MNKLVQNVLYLPMCQEKAQGLNNHPPSKNIPHPHVENSWGQGITLLLLLTHVLYIMISGNIFIMQGWKRWKIIILTYLSVVFRWPSLPLHWLPPHFWSIFYTPKIPWCKRVLTGPSYREKKPNQPKKNNTRREEVTYSRLERSVAVQNPEPRSPKI